MAEPERALPAGGRAGRSRGQETAAPRRSRSCTQDAQACVLFAAIAAVSGVPAEEVIVKTYRIAPGEKPTSEAWPAKLLTKVRKTDLDNPTATNVAVVFTNRRKTIAIRYAGREATDKEGARRYCGSFGWVPPNCNWYHDGFFRLTLNEDQSVNYRFRLMETRSGAKGQARFGADLPDARVVVTFSLLPGDDKLRLDLKLQPNAGKGIESASVFFGCYPSDFAPHSPQTRRRATLTAKRELLNPGPKGSPSGAALTVEEPWVLFYDRHYDVAHGRGAGPCALAYDVSRCTATARCGSYQCSVDAKLRPGVGEISFVLWDLSGVGNADAIEYMRSLRIAPVP